MSHIFVDKDRSLAVTGVYDERSVVADIGGWWDSQNKVWKITFTIENLELLMNKLTDVTVSADMDQKVLEQQEREKKLGELRNMAKADSLINLKIPGLNATLYNYQKIGVLYAMTNSVGLLLADQMGLGKGQVVGTKIYTPTGKLAVETLKVGDSVIGRNGTPIKVTGVFHKPVQDIFRVTFNDGFNLDVDRDHLWYVESGDQLQNKTRGMVLSMNQLLDREGFVDRNGTGHNSSKNYKTQTYFKKENGNNSWHIPVVETIQFDPQPVPIDPYLLGVFLCDGSINKRGYVRLKMLRTDVEEMLGAYDKEEKKCRFPHLMNRYYGEYAYYLCNLGLNGKHSWDKFIPSIYKYNSSEVRLEVLRGLMDTDGSASDCSTEYSTSSRELCDDVVEIVQSLGGIARVRSRIPKYKYKGKVLSGRRSYRVNIKLPPTMNPFRLARKADSYDVPHKYLPGRYITNIEKLPVQAASVCISVDAPDHLYVAEHCIVTHNSVQAIGTSVFMKNKGLAKNALVVVPASLKFNWPLEIEKFTKEKYVVIDGTPEERIVQWLRTDVFFTIVNYELLLEDLFGGRDFKSKRDDSDEQVQKKKLLKEKAERRKRILSPLRERLWDIMIIDEAQALAHHSSKRSRNTKGLHAKFRMALTGTPMNGRLEELHSVMGFVAPGLLGSKTLFFQRHVETDFWGKVIGYKRMNEITAKIQPFFLRRLKENVLKDLPDKIYENRLITLSKDERSIYKKLASKGHEATKDAEAMVAVIRCKQFCNYPQMVEPTCQASSKIDSFLEVIDEVVTQNGNKVLVFSQYKEMLNIIAPKLKAVGVKYLRIDGDTPTKTRADMQALFNNDSSIKAMLGTEAMSTGLNFTSANTVIHIDDNWSPSIMDQRSDRAHRLGQKNVVTVISFICRDTIEERIRDVLYAKSKITAQVLGDETDEMVLRRLGPKDISKLL